MFDYYECGICDHLHPWKWVGDCREDANRFSLNDLEDRGVDIYGPRIADMTQRVEADARGE